MAKELQRWFNDNFMGMVMLKIFVHHHEKDICYTLDDEVERLFERITDKYSRQFNLKYSTSSQLYLSQPELDTDE